MKLPKAYQIVHESNYWQSQETDKNYFLVLHEALGMGDTLDQTLVNPNQLRH